MEFDAMKLAKEAHKLQKYGDLYYEVHLSNVVSMVSKLSSSYNLLPYSHWDAVNVAWLHDCLEDQPEYYNNIPNVPDHIHEAIVAISKQDKETRSEYLKRCCENKLAHFVKICDTMSNLECSVIDRNGKRVSKYTKQLAKLIEYWESKYETI